MHVAVYMYVCRLSNKEETVLWLFYLSSSLISFVIYWQFQTSKQIRYIWKLVGMESW